MEPGLDWTVHDELPPADAAVIDDGLGRANETAAPPHEVRPLACFARRADGRVVGGAVGRRWGLCCELQQLWVDPAWRRRGMATSLLERFHRAAEARGCRSFHLETFSFQAPELYRRLGYESRLELRGYAPGIAKHVMVREVGAAAASAAAAAVPLRGLDHLVLRVIDLPTMLRFYVDVLGCHVERRVDALGLVQLRAGQALIDLVPVDGELGRAGGAPPGREGRNLDHYCLRVEPFDETRLRAHLRAHGVDAGATMQRYGAQGQGPSIYLHDPEGNMLELKGPPTGDGA